MIALPPWDLVVTGAFYTGVTCLFFYLREEDKERRARWAERVAASAKASEEQRAARLAAEAETKAKSEAAERRYTEWRLEAAQRAEERRTRRKAALDDHATDYTGQPIRTPEERDALLARIEQRVKDLRETECWEDVDSYRAFALRCQLHGSASALRSCVFTNPNEGMLL